MSEGIAGDQFAHTAAFPTKKPGNMGDIPGDCGGTRGVGTHGETKPVHPTAH